MYFNGSYTLKRVGVSVMLIPSEGDILKYAIQLEFLVTNNIAEYEVLVTGLQLAKEYDCNNDKMANYLQKCAGGRSFLMSLKYVMSHSKTTVMLMI
jgi:hypothetical protein